MNFFSKKFFLTFYVRIFREHGDRFWVVGAVGAVESLHLETQISHTNRMEGEKVNEREEGLVA